MNRRCRSPLYFPAALTQCVAGMTRFRAGFGLIVAGLLAGLPEAPGLGATAPDGAPEYTEVYRLIKAHALGVTDAELNRAAVQGLLTALGPKVSLLTNSPAAGTNASAATPLVTQASLFEGQIAYLRVARVANGLAGELKRAKSQLESTNSLEGVVLDLRYADGDDYAAAAAAADLFAAKAEPLLNWGAGMVSSQEKTNAIRVPVAVLANRDTAGAAEALAALLRETGAGLILGNRTAGRAMVMQDFPLSAGGRLRLAVAPVTLGDGSALSAEGVQPDISVAVNPQDELAYYANAFVVLPKSGALAAAKPAPASPSAGTNLASRRVRLNEATLVREHREGLDRDLEAESSTPAPEPVKPLVNDPVLARGLDLVTGLALVRRNHF